MVNLRVGGCSHDAATGYLCPCFRCRDDLGRLGDPCNSPARRKASSSCDQPLAYAREHPAGCGCAGDRCDLAQPRTVTWHAHGHLCDRSHAPASCLAVRDDRRSCRVPAMIPWPWPFGHVPGSVGDDARWARLSVGLSVRSPVADQARSRVRREDVGDGSAAEDGGAHRLDGERREEDSLARTQNGRVGHGSPDRWSRPA